MGKKEIQVLVQKFILFEELEGFKRLIQIIEIRDSVLSAEKERITEEQFREKNRENFMLLKDYISKLLFEGESPIVNENKQLKDAKVHILPKTEDDSIRDSEISRIRSIFVGKLVIWDIERALQSGDIESVWQLLEEIKVRELEKFMQNQSDIQEMLSKIADVVCASPDIMRNVLSFEPIGDLE